MGGLLHLVQRGEAWRAAGGPPSHLIPVRNLTAHPSSTISVPTAYCSMWRYKYYLCTVKPQIASASEATALRRYTNLIIIIIIIIIINLIK